MSLIEKTQLVKETSRPATFQTPLPKRKEVHIVKWRLRRTCTKLRILLVFRQGARTKKSRLSGHTEINTSTKKDILNNIADWCRTCRSTIAFTPWADKIFIDSITWWLLRIFFLLSFFFFFFSFLFLSFLLNWILSSGKISYFL